MGALKITNIQKDLPKLNAKLKELEDMLEHARRMDRQVRRLLKAANLTA